MVSATIFRVLFEKHYPDTTREGTKATLGVNKCAFRLNKHLGPVLNPGVV